MCKYGVYTLSYTKHIWKYSAITEQLTYFLTW